MPGTRSGRRRHGRRGQDFDEDSRSSSTSEYRSVDDDDDDEEEELEEQEAEEGESAYDGSVAEEEEGPGRSGLRGRRSKKKKVPRSSSSAPPSKTRRGGGGAAAGASPGSPVAASGAAKREKEEGRPGGAGARARGALQSEGRRTAAGGYSHTVESRLAISRANRGNTPWNKGKSRSEEDVAKIRAGVRARNNLVAKRRRDAYGLSASDDQRLRKQTKYWRERVRRARVDNDRRQEIRAENLRQWQAVEAGLVAAGRRGGRKRPPAPSGSEASSEEGGNEERDHEEGSSGEGEGGGDHDEEKDEGGGAAATTGDGGAGDGHRSDPHEQQLQQQEQERLEPKDRPLVSDDPVSWTPHPLFAVRDPSEVCPGGGPGGFACCPACWSLSARYLAATAGELERQRISSVGLEAVQLQEASAALSRSLEQTSRSTRRIRGRASAGSGIPAPARSGSGAHKRGRAPAPAAAAPAPSALAPPRLKDPPPPACYAAWGDGDEPPFRLLAADPMEEPPGEVYEV